MNPDALSAAFGRRSLLRAGAAAGLLALVGGCGSSPPLRLHRLPLQPPETLPAAAGGTGPAAGLPWELVMRPALPAYLDRDDILVDRGQGRVEALPRERWAEPLSEAIPRLLLHDLALLRGGSLVWPAPAPQAAGVRHRLRVQVLALQAEPAQDRLRLQARWTMEDQDASIPPRVGQVDIAVPLGGPATSDVVSAHRLALWRLAQRVAAEAAT